MSFASVLKELKQVTQRPDLFQSKYFDRKVAENNQNGKSMQVIGQEAAQELGIVRCIGKIGILRCFDPSDEGIENDTNWK